VTLHDVLVEITAQVPQRSEVRVTVRKPARTATLRATLSALGLRQAGLDSVGPEWDHL